ncbi:MAG TPA: FtsQ-type POTRA domain-containing protein, partial [Candidatus Kapabacteria bacterium]|nr:FtsQ-type POTRA domain-containing protein [Candidatus Kapabacteria bacterium]
MKFAKVVAMMMVLALAGLAVAAYHWRSNETIEKINIRGIHMLKEQEILNDAQIVPGGKLASADLNQMRLRLLQNPFISHAVVSRDRQALDIDVTERIPAARVDIDGILSFMDTAGVIFPQRIGLMMDVPIVYGVTKAIDGKEVIDTAAVQEVASVLRLARTSDEKITNTISVIRHLPTGEIQFETNGCAVP